jgi:hypothetical protein
MALITGWGRGTWGEGAWNSPLSVALTGVSAATATGSVAVFGRGQPHSYGCFGGHRSG